MQKTLQDIAELIGAELKGEPQLVITAVSPLNKAQKGELSFISDKKYLDHLESSQASALIVNPAVAEQLSGNLLVMKDPYLGYAKAAQIFDTTPRPEKGIATSAAISETAQLGSNVTVDAHAVIKDGAIIDDNAIIGAGVVIGENVKIGANTLIYPNTVIYHAVEIGRDCIIHANVVLGSDGFGYANDQGQWVKIPQVGSVIIGDSVEIGAHTAIDRGALENTIIGTGVKLDNHIHIAHNVVIGDYTAIAGCTAIAGSTTIGKHCTIAGRVSIIGHLEVCDKAHITATTFVNKSITEPGAYSSGTTFQTNKEWHKSAVRFRQLDEMWRKLKQLEKELGQLKDSRDDNDER
ncbi:UDP-3-O-(3-hydroxymyristoyl)glucosamine N-acyltransferase [Kangiella koreensis]|uniref:UDP-3-O-acylglucosamine N-acyltransferase n=1 Tax=Kangiella koreensis (strain DSM 16069 / JCM 12317 / KCTC 12182 / SW-125) TaxID=523791 RepID=C7R5Y8_KANKD|nr:UDP-3-O-(3-hydroxymyristoyl)glucosamine N-acyltransferase [Kangiella koreensis]ACV27312.1 UDP-3-O-(3-hydroxymyristoyl) glucosamine N- acyltransferase [Kangiella koreensis DSM 16069]